MSYNPLLGPAVTIPNSIGIGGPQTQGVPAPNTVVIDGTPVRVVILALSAAGALMALKWAGFRFNVGVS
jgi:hypothetical protein